MGAQKIILGSISDLWSSIVYLWTPIIDSVQFNVAAQQIGSNDEATLFTIMVLHQPIYGAP